MADYIKGNILCQAYIHVEHENTNLDFDIGNFEKKITEFVKSRTSFFLSPDAIIEIHFEDGSLKSRVTILGTILLLMQGVANYTDFREGIQFLYGDTKRLAEYIISECLFESKAKHQDIIRLEARAGIVGSVQKVINQLEIIKTGANGSMLASEIVTRLAEARSEINKLYLNINDEKDREFIVTGLYDSAKKIPDIPIPPKDKTNHSSHVALYSDERKRLIDLLEEKSVNK